MPTPYVSQRQVEFRDTDAAGIMHFSTYFTYMEEVEHEFLRSLGTSVVTPIPDSDTGSKISFPRVAAQCQYSGTACFEDLLEIEIQVTRVGNSSVTYGFRFQVDGQLIAEGSLTSVCCRITAGLPPESMPIPESLRSELAKRVAK